MEVMGLGLLALEAEKAHDWYQVIGIPTEGTRLREIRDFIVDRLMNTSTQEARQLEAGIVEPNTYSALADARGFGLIAETLKGSPHLGDPDLKQTLIDIVAGPLLLSDETVGPLADARNKFVELELAAFMGTSGLNIVGFDDLRFEFEGAKFLVECKRPYSANGLRRNIEKAYSQVSRKLGSTNERGIVAIAVDKVYDLDSKLQPVSVGTEATNFAVNLTKRFLSDTRALTDGWVDPRIVGLAAIIRFLARGPDGQIGYCNVFGLGKVASASSGQAADEAKLDRLIERVRR